jgi:hypothetical protein
MSYTPRGRSMGADASGMHMFDNVFVNPEAYRSFLETGTWPDKTILALETRGSETDASINKGGHSQTPEQMGLEVHVKDASRGGWAFYSFDEPSPDKPSPAKKILLSADCYSCHRDHAAVDTTFAQFYPTLLPVGKQKGTLSASYLKEVAK